MNVSGRWDRHNIVDLGRKLGMIERATGYRQPLGADGYKIMQRIFTCDEPGLTKRLNGKTKVTDFELSRIVHTFGLDLHGIHPDHLLLDADAFDAALKAMGAGIYGASEAQRFAAAARRFEGAPARIAIRHVRRGPGFGLGEPEDGAATLELCAGQRVRFRCEASADGRLLVLDHRVDAEGVAHLLSPAEPGDWIDVRGGVRCDCPAAGRPMLHVHAAPGERRVTALWVDPPFGSRIEARIEAHALAHRTGRPKRGTAAYRAEEDRDAASGTAGFREVPVAQLSALTQAMERGEGGIRAVAGCDYRVID